MRYCRQKAQTSPFRSLTLFSPALAPRHVKNVYTIHPNNNCIYIYIYIYIYIVLKNMYCAKKKVLPSLFSSHCHVVFHGFLTKESLSKIPFLSKNNKCKSLVTEIPTSFIFQLYTKSFFST